MNLTKTERYLRINVLGPDPRRMKKEFTGSLSDKGWETPLYISLTSGFLGVCGYGDHTWSYSKLVQLALWAPLTCVTEFVEKRFFLQVQFHSKYRIFQQTIFCSFATRRSSKTSGHCQLPTGTSTHYHSLIQFKSTFKRLTNLATCNMLSYLKYNCHITTVEE